MAPRTEAGEGMSETEEGLLHPDPELDGHSLLVRAALAALPGLVTRYGHRRPEELASRAFAIANAFVAEAKTWEPGEGS